MLSVFPQGHFQPDPVLVTILLVPIRCQTVIGTVLSSFWGFEEKRGEYEKPGAGMACLECQLHAHLWVLPRKGRLGGVVLTGPPNGDLLLALAQALPAVVPPEPLPAHPGASG